MRTTCKIAAMVTVLSLWATALPARSSPAASDSPQIKVVTPKNVVETKPQQAITVSVTPMLKSAEPLPQQFVLKCNPEKPKAPRKSTSKIRGR